MRAPAWATTSGMRNAPPISTSWPRETTRSRPPPARAAAARSTAAAPLVTARGGCGAGRRPGQLAHRPRGGRVARAALAVAEVELEIRVALRRAGDRRARLGGER